MRITKKDERAALAASMRFSVTNPNDVIRLKTLRSSKASDRAWNWYDQIGEVHYALNEVAREISRCRLIAQERNKETGEWEEVDSGPAFDLVEAIEARNGGQGRTLANYYIQTKVTGESWLIIYEKDDETWFDMVSLDELQNSGTTGRSEKLMRRTMPDPGNGMVDGQGLEDIPPGSDLIRFWVPHPRWSMVSDSPLYALDTICEELDILTKSLMAKIKSRLAMSGIVFIPNTIHETNTAPPSGDPTGLPDDGVIRNIVLAMTSAILDPSSASAIMPILLRGPADAGEQIRWIEMNREMFKVDIEQRAELLMRLVHGLDIQPEVLNGTGDANHWSAWTSSNKHVTVQVAGDLEPFCAGLTKDYLRVQLVDELGFAVTEARRFRIWHDLTPITTKPNLAEDVRQARDRGAVNLTAVRRSTGMNEADAMTEDEYIRWVGEKVRDPYLATFGLDLQEEIDWDKVGTSKNNGPTPDNPGGDPSVGPGVGDPGSPDDNDSDTRKGNRPSGG